MKKEYFNPIEQASIDEIKALQFERMSHTLQYAYDNVPLYKQKFDAKGIHPQDLKTLSDLRHFPFTVKDDLRENYPFNLFAVPMKGFVRLHASSGTTGKPTVVGYTKNDIDIWSEVVARSIYAAGGRKESKVHVAYGYGLFTGGLGAHYGAEKLEATVIPMSGGNTARQVQLIEDFGADIIMVTPSYMLNIIEEYKKRGLDPTQSPLKIGIFGAEPWTQKMRTYIEQVMQMNATDIYGLSEIIGPGVAQECVESKDGLTVWEDHFYPEIINPETGEVLPDGKDGELVFTSLTKDAMPIIRYRTKDLTKLMQGTARSMRRIEKITGRNDDMMIVRGVNVFPSQIEHLVLEIPELSPFYQIELASLGEVNHLIVNAEMKGSGSRQTVSDTLQKSIKSYIGINVEVKIHESNSIARSEGKAQRVIDLRNRKS